MVTPVVTNVVLLSGTNFTPPAIQVAEGATVTFTNADGLTHNVIFDNAAILDVADFTKSTRSVAMPLAPGLYPYRCTLHNGMTGSVKVGSTEAIK